MFFKDKKILVTGASGFTGTNLIKRLLEEGAFVRGVLHINKPQSVVVSDRIEYVYGDLTKKEDCSEVVDGIDYVFMCAANTSGAAVMENSPLSHVTPNVLMNTLMLDAAYKAKVKKFLFISSTTVYPLSDKTLEEEDVDGNLFEKYYCVGSMKLFSENLCRMYSTKIKNPMTTIIVRPGNLYGDYDDFKWETSHSTAALIRKVVEKHSPIEVWGDGNDLKDITYISDLVDGLLLAMEKIDKFDIVNIASGASHTIKETLKIIMDIENFDGKIVYDASKPTMIPKRNISIEKARKLIGFEPKVSLEEGLKKTINWYKNNFTNE